MCDTWMVFFSALFGFSYFWVREKWCCTTLFIFKPWYWKCMIIFLHWISKGSVSLRSLKAIFDEENTCFPHIHFLFQISVSSVCVDIVLIHIPQSCIKSPRPLIHIYFFSNNVKMVYSSNTCEEKEDTHLKSQKCLFIASALLCQGTFG